MGDGPGNGQGSGAQGADGPQVRLGEATLVWWRIALLSFGGPAGQIALMHRVLVEERRWISESRFLHALNYCMLLPGPEAQQLAVYIGWLMHRTVGGLIAGLLFILPGLVSIMLLSWIYAVHGEVTLVQGLFFGLKTAVLAIVLEAVIRIGRRSLRSPVMLAVAVCAFVAIFAFRLPFPLIILMAAVVGYIAGRSRHPSMAVITPQQGNSSVVSVLGEETPDHARPSLRWSLLVSSICLGLWLVPIAVLIAVTGIGSTFSQIAIFFSKMAVVTFGGAYAVLTYVAQQAVDHFGWLRPGEMVDGLGMAETTPGPLIMVTQFVGFMAAFRDPGLLSPVMAGIWGGLLTTWVTFVPCFMWIFLGAPYAERLRDSRALSAALAAISAAVVGVILNLAIWFALHVLFSTVTEFRAGLIRLEVPDIASLDLVALGLSVAALIAVFALRIGIIPVLAGAAIAGVVLRGL